MAGISAAKRINQNLRQKMIDAILRHGGAEVLFVADQDKDGQLSTVNDLAHGSSEMVAVVAKNLKDGQVLIHNHPSGDLRASNADVRMAASLADRGIGSWIVDNQVEQIYILTEAQVAPEVQKIDPQQATAIFASQGPMAVRFPGYEPRKAQIEMVDRVLAAFNDNSLAAIEAGTGVGKSFAYLIPALLWAAANNERIVISTATINLQQQLFEKDIPTVKAILGLDFKAVLAKGRGNYLCVKRLAEALDEEDTLIDPDGPFMALKDWSRNSPDGTRSDIPFVPEDALWSRVNADADACPGMRCPQRDECFFFRARREAASARIIVANHHLVFADAAMRHKGFGFEATVVLPGFQRLILDEAHSIDSAATSFFSDELHRFGVLKLLAILQRRKKNRSFGLLPLLESQGLINIANADDLIGHVRDGLFRVDSQALVLMGEANTLRIEASNSEACGMLFKEMAELQKALLSLSETLGEATAAVDSEEPIPALEELEMLAKRFGASALVCGSFRNWHQNPDRVYYLERIRNSTGDSAVQFIASPLDVGPLLAEAIFRPYPTVIMTSATLRVGQSFDFFLRRIGLWAEAPKVIKTAKDEWGDEWSAYADPDFAPKKNLAVLTLEADLFIPAIDRYLNCAVLSSPFDYASRVLLGLCQDGPEPQDPGYPAWIADFVARALLASGGHGLVLFTSYDLLRRTYDAVQPQLLAKGVISFRQGNDERSRLLKQFNANLSSCLFATDSFWEGVDSPGDTLQLVILCRLPFRVPTEPLILARSERIEARGGSSFMEISVPEAVMKLRQGFGRLMRHEKDHGVVLIADRRIVSKPYGRIFLDSLPPAKQLIAPANVLFRDLECFLDYHRKQKRFDTLSESS